MNQKRSGGAFPLRTGGARAARGIALTALLALASCAMESVTGGTAKVDGFDVRVTSVRGMPGVFRATHSVATSQDGRYYARQIIAIREVTGCRVDARNISHDGATSTAGVLCA